ncbi:hypothetical protein N431DRAFT_528255 [Stipitochalara longipes BDJ]|nr:hypothetical protein N431DRAFT_528255 [Stipitochalara longipes BDJ]
MLLESCTEERLPWKGDIIILVSPGSIEIYLASAEAIRQVTAKREAFPKPLESYRVLDILGRNVITSEACEWKQHRKVVLKLQQEEQCTGFRRSNKIKFTIGLLWPGEKPGEKESIQDAIFSSSESSKGHSMSYETSTDTLLANLVWMILTPKWWEKHLPFQGARKAHESFINWCQYMEELFAQKIKEAQGSNHSHETTASTLHFALVELVTNPESQKLLQMEIASIFGSEATELWDYDANINALLPGMRISRGYNQIIIIDGKSETLPVGGNMPLNVVGTHKDPKYWPSQPSKVADDAHDLNDLNWEDGRSNPVQMERSKVTAPWTPRMKKSLGVLGKILQRNFPG